MDRREIEFLGVVGGRSVDGICLYIFIIKFKGYVSCDLKFENYIWNCVIFGCV